MNMNELIEWDSLWRGGRYSIRKWEHQTSYPYGIIDNEFHACYENYSTYKRASERIDELERWYERP